MNGHGHNNDIKNVKILSLIYNKLTMGKLKSSCLSYILETTLGQFSRNKSVYEADLAESVVLTIILI